MVYAIGTDHRDAPASAQDGSSDSGLRSKEQRSSNPIDRLSRDLDLACTTSINPHQIAALLEAEGINDRIARERYLSSDVFSLATDLYQRVPLRRHKSAQPADKEATQGYVQHVTGALVMRGPIYLLPVLFFVAARDFLSRPQMLSAGLIALLLAWSWNQGSGALVHRLIGRGNVPAAMAMSRVSMLAGTVAVTATVSVALPGAFGDATIGLFSAGQTAYLIAAATLLTLGHDRLLAMALVPGVAILGVLVIPGVPSWVVGAAMALTLFLVLVAMVWATRGSKRLGLLSLPGSDWTMAGAHALLGGMWAILIGLAGFSIADSEGAIGMVSIAAAPMVLTMGVAEWQLLRLRRVVARLLGKTGSLEGFTSGARVLFGQSVAVFAAALVSVAGAVVAVAYSLGVLSSAGVLLAVGFVWLGTAFFAGLTLLAMGRVGVALSASTYVAIFVGFLLLSTPHNSSSGAGLYAAGCFGLSFVMISVALAVIPNAVVHR